MQPKVVAVLGCGIFGSSICKTLSSFNTEIIAIDKEEENINRIEQHVTVGVVEDFTDIEALKAVGVDRAEVAIIGSSSNLEGTILAVMNLQQLEVPEIIVKVKNKVHMNILNKLGVSKVIRPEKEIGEKVGRDIMRNNIIESIYLDEKYSVVEFKLPNSWKFKTLAELDVRKKYGINIIGVRHEKEGELDMNILGITSFNENDIIVAIAETNKFESLDSLHKL